MVMYDNEFETKEKKIWTKGKIEAQHKQQIWISWWRDLIFSLFAVIEKNSFYTRNNVPLFLRPTLNKELPPRSLTA